MLKKWWLALGLAALTLLGGCTLPWQETVTIGGQEVVVDKSLKQSGHMEEQFAAQENGRVTYTGGASRTGIDVSVHQQEIDWQAVAADGIQFAVLRVGARGYSEGALIEDSFFQQNYDGAKAAGLDVGAYFFSQAVTADEAREEAEYALTLLDGRALDLPVFYDWETIDGDTARTDGLDPETVTACAVAFCETVEAGGYSAGCYCNGMLGYLTYDLSALQDYPIWYAEYGDWPSFAYAHSFWQYSKTGTVAGIEGNVDLDLQFLPDEN